MCKFRGGYLFSLFQLCKKHHFGIDKPERLAQSPDDSKFLMKTFSQIKSNVAVPIKKKVRLTSLHHPQVELTLCTPFLLHFILCASFRVSLSPLLSPLSLVFTHPLQYSPAFQVKENKEKERLERRLLDELYKIFMDSDSFYYSMTYDLTNSVQRQGGLDKSDIPLWKQVWRGTRLLDIVYISFLLTHCYWYSLFKVDDRFFWNKHMIQDVIDLKVICGINIR